MDDLTKEQKYLLTLMYKEFLSRQPALSPDKANYFTDSNEIQRLFLPNLPSDYISDMCWSLKSKGYLVCYPGDDLANDISLTDKTVIYMENRFANGVKAFADFLSKIKP